MKRLLGIIAATVFVTLSVSASALALPTVLPEVFPNNVTGKGITEVTIETPNANTLRCAKATGTGQITGAHEGTFDLMLEECSALIGGTKFSCNSLGDASGVKLLKGTLQPVFDSLSPLGAALLYTLSPELHTVCGGIILYLTKGSIIILVTPINTKVKTFKAKFEQEKGKQKQKRYWNAEGVEVQAGLLTSKNGGAFEEVGLLVELEATVENEIEVMA